MSVLVRLLSALWVSCALLLLAQDAEAQSPAPPPLFPPAAEVDTHDPAYLERVELAERSLVGPSVEMASGIVMISVGGVVNLAALLSWIGGNELSGGATFGATLAVVGAGTVMTWHGATRIDRIKTARRALTFEGLGVGATARGGHANVRFAF